MKEPKRYEIPKDAIERKCRSCGASIFWGVTEKQKRIPLNPDGTSHYTTCPQASMWSKK